MHISDTGSTHPKWDINMNVIPIYLKKIISMKSSVFQTLQKVSKVQKVDFLRDCLYFWLHFYSDYIQLYTKSITFSKLFAVYLCSYHYFIRLNFLAIQWKFDNGNLTSRAISWIYDNKKWSIPDEGKEGFIKVIDADNVMSLVGQSAGSKVILEARNDLPNQKWVRGQSNKNGWFTMQNLWSGLYLNNDINSNDLDIEGNLV